MDNTHKLRRPADIASLDFTEAQLEDLFHENLPVDQESGLPRLDQDEVQLLDALLSSLDKQDANMDVDADTRGDSLPDILAAPSQRGESHSPNSNGVSQQVKSKNQKAQRAFRERQKAKHKALETQLTDLRQQLEDMHTKQELLNQQNSHLTKALEDCRAERVGLHHPVVY